MLISPLVGSPACAPSCTGIALERPLHKGHTADTCKHLVVRLAWVNSPASVPIPTRLALECHLQTQLTHACILCLDWNMCSYQHMCCATLLSKPASAPTSMRLAKGLCMWVTELTVACICARVGVCAASDMCWRQHSQESPGSDRRCPQKAQETIQLGKG